MNEVIRELSQAERVSLLNPEQYREVMGNMTQEQFESLKWDWKFWGRPKQLPPSGDWSTWVIRAGRGFGKTRTGVHWVHDRAMDYPQRWVALVARTPADARDYMIEGPGGFLRNIHPAVRPNYEPSKKRLTWPNGSWATIYSDDEPDQLRGFSGDTAWLDEFAKFKNPTTCWDNLQFGMREASSDRPRRLITTTPRPLEILVDIEKMSSTIRVIGSSYENKANLDPTWFADTIEKYVGTRLGRQEIDAEILMDMPGALWNRAQLDKLRLTNQEFENRCANGLRLVRVVVGVDPSGSSGPQREKRDRNTQEKADDIGINISGLGSDGRAYVLGDWTCNLGPSGWARRVCEAYSYHLADAIIAERNFGGAMVEAVIRTENENAPVKLVTASRGKVARAEPVAALYEQGKVSHIGLFPELEDQMMMFAPHGYLGAGSPDRSDALIWALTELMVDEGLQGETGTVKLRAGWY